MLTTYQTLVEIKSTEDQIDPLVIWLQALECWLEIEDLWRETNPDYNVYTGFIPVSVELELKDYLKLSPDCLRLFEILQHDDIGLPLEALGAHPGQVSNVLREGLCSWTRLEKLKLARVQRKRLLKALPLSFDPRVHYLVGYSPSL